MIEDEETFDTSLGRVLDLALAHRLSAYDAAYLELCLCRGLALATFDAHLAKVASSQGVPLVIDAVP